MGNKNVIKNIENIHWRWSLRCMWANKMLIDTASVLWILEVQKFCWQRWGHQLKHSRWWESCTKKWRYFLFWGEEVINLLTLSDVALSYEDKKKTIQKKMDGVLWTPSDWRLESIFKNSKFFIDFSSLKHCLVLHY